MSKERRKRLEAIRGRLKAAIEKRKGENPKGGAPAQDPATLESIAECMDKAIAAAKETQREADAAEVGRDKARAAATKDKAEVWAKCATTHEVEAKKKFVESREAAEQAMAKAESIGDQGPTRQAALVAAARAFAAKEAAKQNADRADKAATKARSLAA